MTTRRSFISQCLAAVAACGLLWGKEKTPAELAREIIDSLNYRVYRLGPQVLSELEQHKLAMHNAETALKILNAKEQELVRLVALKPGPRRDMSGCRVYTCRHDV